MKKITMASIRKQQARAVRERRKKISDATWYLRELEKGVGHQGVFAAIRDWMKKPYRGNFS